MLKVLHSLSPPDDRANPYVLQLLEATSERIENSYFNYVLAIFGRYDVFHAQWPEYLLRSSSPLKRYVKAFLFGLVLLRIALFRTPVVQTIHNTAPHESGRLNERLALRLLNQLTHVWVRLNEFTPPRPPITATILHGHYRDWFAIDESICVLQGKLTCFGLIRKYKGIETLLRAFSEIADSDLRLRIVGAPVALDVAEVVSGACVADARVSALLKHVSDSVLAEEILSSELIVLPYSQMHNSGAVLLALSLSRPVLVPANPITRSLADEVGPGWVYFFDGELTASSLVDSLNAVRRDVRAPRPRLEQRNWNAVGAQHEAVYLSVSGRCNG